MLVLTRKVGEGIAIGDDVKIVVMQIKGKQVRLGIKASPSTIVHREEIYQKIQEENRLASESNKTALDQVKGLFKSDDKSVQKDSRDQEKPSRAPLRRHVRPPRDDD